jgi:hypothetical protein
MIRKVIATGAVLGAIAIGAASIGPFGAAQAGGKKGGHAVVACGPVSGGKGTC